MNDGDILEAIKYGHMEISDFRPELVQQVSVDLRLDRKIRVFDEKKHWYIDPTMEQPGLTVEKFIEPGEALLLDPGEAILAQTYEVITLGPTIAGKVEGKSSLGRNTLRVHATAGLIDPGFDGRITLELDVSGRMPVKLWPGMLIAQITFERLAWPVQRPYGSPEVGSHYQGQQAPMQGRPVAVYDI